LKEGSGLAKHCEKVKPETVIKKDNTKIQG
jgi:hypothetical protein